MTNKTKIKMQENTDIENEKKENPRLKKDKAEENKLVKNILIFIGIFFLVLFVSFLVLKSSDNPKYKGLTFNTIQEGELTFHQTTIPVIYKNKINYFNVYLRNSPKELKRKVAFNGEIEKIDNTVIEMPYEFDCDGDQIIAIANLANVYGAIGKKLVKDENASCDEEGKYAYLVVQPGKKTSIEKYGLNCYNITIKDCEILEGTERFILEILAKYNSDIYE